MNYSKDIYEENNKPIEKAMADQKAIEDKQANFKELVKEMANQMQLKFNQTFA